ncbi:Lrp/AsnC family transcriptional regulator [Streptomyces sioyaensis]|uniref:Lrp/AsnC family transcriptional regulator n=1 Tax=Streptomyces sioyaensis TaxID=67364 RepID=UPI00365BD52E
MWRITALGSVNVVESIRLDEDDRRVLHALQLDGRASFARIATVLGMSERSVSRRYHRLRSRLALRVVGVTRHDQRAQEDWFLRIAAPPASVDAVARMLAVREDTSWIASLAGSGGLSCILRTPVPTGDGGNALEQFRRGANVGTVTAQRLLAPVAGVGGWPGRLQALTASEREALASTAPERHASSASSAGAPRSDGDERLLGLLAADGRMSVARLAGASDIPESTVRRRIGELVNRGVLMFEVEVDPKLYGRHIDVLCWLDVQPAALRAVANGLSSHSEVAFASTTTGTSNVLAFLEFAATDDLYEYLADRVGALPGVHRVQTEIVSRWVKRAGPLLIPRA